MITRRDALRQLALASGGMALAPLSAQIRATRRGATPKRFVFIVRSNGILAPELQPRGLEHLVKIRANHGWQKTPHTTALAKHDLPTSLAPIAKFKDRITIHQGLSGKMCRGAHEAGFGALGAYASQAALPPRKETIDGALAAQLGGVFPHIGFAMHDEGAAMAYPRLSAAGPNQVLPYYADPKLAYQELFGTIIRGTAKAEVDIDRNILDFMSRDVKRFQANLSDREREKLDHYLHGFEALQARQKKLQGMRQSLAKAAPKLRAIYSSKVETERLQAHFELATAALIGGLTQVVAIRCDNLNSRLHGLGLGSKTMHQIGHMIEGKKGGSGGAPFADGSGELATRAKILNFHMQQVAGMVERLAAVPEGDGTMLDNTLILYLSDHGDRHHSKFFEWPLLAVGNVGGKLRTGRYLHSPGYQSQGHQTIGQLYLTLLHAAGHPRDGFGDRDLKLGDAFPQSEPLANWLA